MEFRAVIEGRREIVARFESIPRVLQRELYRTFLVLTTTLRTFVMERYLSGPTGAHTLSVRTGRLRRSVKRSVTLDANGGVTGRVSYGADVPYARIHELGGVIREIRPVNAQALHFTWQGRERFFARVGPIVIPQRAPLRTAFENASPTIILEIDRALQRAIDRSGPTSQPNGQATP